MPPQTLIAARAFGKKKKKEHFCPTKILFKSAELAKP